VSETQVPAPGRALFTKKGRKIALIALAVAIVGALGLRALMSQIDQNLVYYWGPHDVLQNGEKAYGVTIRLGGMVQAGSIQFDEGKSDLRFTVSDGQAVLPVHTSGVPPQMFRERIGVVVEGKMGRDGVFQGHKLMVSHGNEYRAPKPGEPVDIQKMIESAKQSADSEGK
jgi:cytochrome c-type biogenesis protein CcmE